MCEIGRPIEIIQVEPLNLPAPLPGHENEPEPKPRPAAPVYVPVTVEIEGNDMFDEVKAHILL